MRTSKPRVTEYLGSKTSKSVVEGLRVDGKRARKFFRKRSEAESWLRLTLARMKKEGTASAVHMSERLRVEASECAKRLKPFGKTITDATNRSSHAWPRWRVAALSANWPKRCWLPKSRTAHPRYLKDTRIRLDAFETKHGESIVGAMTGPEIDDWLRGLEVPAQTRNNYRTVLQTFLEYAVARGYALENPVAKLAKAKVVRGAPAVFTPEQMQKIMASAPHDFIPYLAIGRSQVFARRKSSG